MNIERTARARALPKAPTGIDGLDEITDGGLPRGRPTLICGGPGCGKTLLATEFLVRGATQFGEPGVFISFEETGEELAQNERSLTRQGLEEYVSDCVILLDHRVNEQVSTRRLRIVKYRGTTHGTNEYPFLIDESGFSVLPLSGVQLDHAVSNERVSSGVPGLDE